MNFWESVFILKKKTECLLLQDFAMFWIKTIKLATTMTMWGN